MVLRRQVSIVSLKLRNELDPGTNLDHNLEEEGECYNGNGLGSETGRIEEQLGDGVFPESQRILHHGELKSRLKIIRCRLQSSFSD